MPSAFSYPLDAASNVVITGPSDRDALVYDAASSRWINEAQAGTSLTVEGDEGVDVSTVDDVATVKLAVQDLDEVDALADDDYVPIYDVSGTAHKRVAASVLRGGEPSVTVETDTEGVAPVAGTNAKYALSFYGSPTGSITLTHSGNNAVFADVGTDVYASNVDSVLEGLASIGSGNLTVVGAGGGAPENVTIEFVGARATSSQTLTVPSNTLSSAGMYVTATEATKGTAVNTVYVVYPTETPGTFEKQKIVGDASVTAGTYTITVMGQTTSALQWNATAAQIMDALNALSTGDTYFAVTSSSALQSGGEIEITFIQADYGNANESLMSITSSLTGGTYTTSAITNGTGSTDTPSGSYQLNFVAGGATVGPLNAGDDPATVQAAIVAEFGSGTATVTNLYSSSGGIEKGLRIEFTGSLAGTDPGMSASNSFTSGGVASSLVLSGSQSAEVQTLTVNGSPTQGQYSLVYTAGTVTIAYNANAAAIQTAYRLVGAFSSVTVSGTNPYTVTFPAALGDVDEPTVDGSRLLYSLTQTQAGAAGTAGTEEVQIVTLANVRSGSFTLDEDGTTIGPINWNATSTDVETAFDDAGFTVTVTGESSPWSIAFDDSHGNVEQMTGDASGLSNGTAPSGWSYHTFAYGDASPATLLTVSANKHIVAVKLLITEAFDGTGASLKLGDVSDDDSVMTTADNSPAIQGTFELSPQSVWGSATALRLTITPGSGATQGRGVVALQIEP